MHVEYTPEQQRLRREFRAYLQAFMTPQLRAATRDRESGPEFRAALRRMGADGWLTPGWPREYGGRGLDPLAQKIVLEELWLAEAPFPFVTVNTIGPALIRRGTAEQKRELLPRIARGELNFAIGYSEAQAGTDLAALRTRAERHGDDFIINGQKVFTSGAEGADYIWLAARTDPQASAHRGISILMVDTRLPGFALSPIHTVGGIRTNVTYYKDVRVPASMLVGSLHGGWQLITEQLNHERVGLAALAYGAQACFDATLAWARASPGAAGRRLIDEPWVQMALAECYALLQAYAVLGNRVAWEVAQGETRAPLASACKVFSTESYIRVLRLLLDVAGAAGLLREGSPGALLSGRLEGEYRRCQINTFGGGATEVLRDMVAQMGLGLPRAPASR
ncbi:MAG TPA: acyl-CoA dehydrogenase family protein [Steroidobacteraceae bacterium]|nr:acyl-CoA dehydrogenase family protein [Steroidobacteraceae bacterium]